MKKYIKKFLEKCGILFLLFKTKEYTSCLLSKEEKIHSEEYRVPEKYLRRLVGEKEFLLEGKKISQNIMTILQENNIPIIEKKSILDFGCGCGRVLRYFSFLSNHSNLYGCDYNKKLVKWCKENLSFAEIAQNNSIPPLPYSQEKFDLIYANSVFTHLTEDLQDKWLSEIERTLKQGGHFIFTFHGESHFENLYPEEREIFISNRLVVRYPSGSGSNLCAVFHPLQWIEKHLPKKFHIIDHWKRPIQDMILIGKF